MRCSLSIERKMLSFILLFSMIGSLQGCFPYTSSFIEDPTSRKVTKGVDPAADIVKKPVILVEGAPSAENPRAPITVRAVERMTGPEAETKTFNEYKYKRYWSPLIIPVGLLQVVSTPFICLGAGLDPSADTKALDQLFAGRNEKNCEAKGWAMMGVYGTVGIIPTCEVRETNARKEKNLTGRTVTEDQVYQNAQLRMAIAPLFSSESPGPVAVSAKSQAVDLDSNGRAEVSPFLLFRDFPQEPREVNIAFSFADSPQVSERVVIDQPTSEALYIPVREERAAEQAERDGKQAAALEHYGRAYAAVSDRKQKQALWKKFTALYRSLPTKPAVPEDARRFMVRGQAAIESAKASQDFDIAIREFEQAAATAPGWPDIYYNLGVLLGKSGRYDDGIANLQKYLDLTPAASDAEQVKNMIYQFEYKKEKASGQGTGQSGRSSRK